MPRPKTHKRISITIPIELDFLADSLVKESQKSSTPWTKSNLIAVALDEFLKQHLVIGKPNPEKEVC